MPDVNDAVGIARLCTRLEVSSIPNIIAELTTCHGFPLEPLQIHGPTVHESLMGLSLVRER